jgi:hypothetical protein
VEIKVLQEIMCRKALRNNALLVDTKQGPRRQNIVAGEVQRAAVREVVGAGLQRRQHLRELCSRSRVDDWNNPVAPRGFRTRGNYYRNHSVSDLFAPLKHKNRRKAISDSARGSRNRVNCIGPSRGWVDPQSPEERNFKDPSGKRASIRDRERHVIGGAAVLKNTCTDCESAGVE